MSLLLMVIYWVAIPVFALLAVQRLLRRARRPLYKELIFAVGAAGFLGWFWLVAGEKLWLDHQVRELCAKDGGVRVYETVKLPAYLLDKAGRVWIPDKAQAKPSDEYYYVSDTYYYRKGNPTMYRKQHRIVRRSDGKVLGELTRYVRSGGDLPGPWYGSGFMCPDPTKESNFESSIFVNGDKK
ncbi:MAG: hypothetical protein K8F27_14735 [Sulfuricellaceae bacterium]|nr:hypothetical protein [Sulfuricellaceae bacterium]